MKRIVSVSIGSSSRDKSVEADILGERYQIQRIGTNGDLKQAINLIKELDGKVDAFGMGGIDLCFYTYTGKKCLIKEAMPIKAAAKVTPMLDGTGLKNTLEKKVIEYLRDNGIIEFKNKKVLVVCSIDRVKMTEAIVESGSQVTIGDFIFALDIPLPIKSYNVFKRIANILLPIVCMLPFEMLYPTGEKQKQVNENKNSEYYRDADIIAGDFHYIKKYMPQDMKGKIIITNTVTQEDVDMLRKRGVKMLVTTTPELDGRSFGTNVMEAVLISASGKRPEDLTEGDYFTLLNKLDFKPRIEYLNA